MDPPDKSDAEDTDSNAGKADVGDISDPNADVSANPSHVGSGLAPGSKVERYIILEKLGEGGMGVVYSAFDPQLDRKVAIKLVRRSKASKQNPAMAERLLNEAKAVAKLSHPNVVTVYDAGTWEGQVYISMEYVEGQSISEWLEEQKREWREVLRVFVEAGRGLAAAHAVGIVHRDFKPDNMIMGRDQRVRVIDFGIAQELGKPDELLQSLAISPAGKDERGESGANSSEGISQENTNQIIESARNRKSSLRLTPQGVVLGTPEYIALEQQYGEGSNASSDQFSFCVSFYRALYGVLPFKVSPLLELGTYLLELARKKKKGLVTPPPTDMAAPVWLHRVILKGLAAKPEERWASMDQLLEKLAYDPNKIKKRVLFAVGFLLLLGIGFGSWMYTRSYQESQCERGAEVIGGAWNENIRKSTHQAFSVTGVSYAEDMWNRVGKQLDDYARDWVDEYRAACQATHLTGQQTEHLKDLRLACLKRRLEEFTAMIELFSKADAKLVERSVEAVGQMEAIHQCADGEGLLKQWTMLKTPKNPQQVDAIRKEIAKLMALENAMQCEKGRPFADGVVQSAQEVQYAPVEAEALYWSGRMSWQCGEFKDSEEYYQKAFGVALQNGYELLTAKTAVELTRVTGVELAHQEDWKVWEDISEHLVERQGNMEPERSRLTTIEGIISFGSGKIDDALQHFQDALEMRKKAYGSENMLVIYSLHMIGNLYNEKEQPLHAIAHYQQSLALLEKVTGRSHPFVGDILLGLGDSYSLQNDLPKARELFEQALQLMEKNYGRKNYYTAIVLQNLAMVLSRSGQHQQAIVLFKEALTILTEIFSPDNPNVMDAQIELAAAYSRKGDLQQAKETYLQAIEKLGAANENQNTLAKASLGIGEVYLRLGEGSRGQRHLEQALECYRRSTGENNPLTVRAMTALGVCYLESGQLSKANSLLESAIVFYEKQDEINRIQLSRAQFSLAQSLSRTSDQNQPRIEELVRKAYENYLLSKVIDEPLLKKMEKFVQSQSIRLDDSHP